MVWCVTFGSDLTLNCTVSQFCLGACLHENTYGGVCVRVHAFVCVCVYMCVCVCIHAFDECPGVYVCALCVHNPVNFELQILEALNKGQFM